MREVHFYLNDDPNKELEVEINPTLAQTLDESLDNLTITLIANQIQKPYLPMQKVTMKDENGVTIQTFILSADNVQQIGFNPERYNHTLTLTQYSDYLTKHEIRNSVFSRSLNNQNSTSVGISVKEKATGINAFDYDTVTPTQVSIKLKQSTIKKIYITPLFWIEKIESTSMQTLVMPDASIRINYYYYCKPNSPRKWEDIFATYSAYSDANVPSLKFNINGTDKYYKLPLDFANKGLYEVDSSIINFINQNNVTDIPVAFDSVPFISYSGWTGDKPTFINLSAIINIVYEEDNVYNVLNTLLKQQMKETEDYNSTNDSDHIKPLFKLPTLSHNKELYNLLLKTEAPNFVFTQCTMYDALAEIFKLFDAIFTIDDDGYLDIEYFNEHKQITVAGAKKAGVQSSLGEERFTNRMITYFQNTKINDKFPNSNDVTATAYIRSKSLSVPEESDYVFVVPKPIDYINRVYLSYDLKLIDKTYGPYFSDASTGYNYHYIFTSYTGFLDITDNVVESSIWSLLPNDTTFPIDGDWSNLGKQNCFSYTRGSKYIDISGYYSTKYNIKQSIFNNVVKGAILRQYGLDFLTANWGVDPTPSWQNVRMSVSYIALVDGKLVNESIDNKYNGELLINQANGSIDINKLGLNMVGLSLKLGQPTLSLSQTITSWDNRIKKGQFFIDENGDKWVANTCTYTLIKPDLIRVGIEFVKNFNGLAKRIELNSEKRLSNISNELTVKCEETYGEFLYYSTLPFADMPEKIAMNPFIMVNQISMGFSTTVGTIQAGIIDTSATYVETTTIATVGSLDHSRRYLYFLHGYVEEGTVNGGPIKLNDSVNLDGNSIVVSNISTKADALEYDAIEKVFNYNLSDDSVVEVGDYISIYLVVDESDNIQFGAVSKINSDNTDFKINLVPLMLYDNTYTVEYALVTAYNSDNSFAKANGVERKNIAAPLCVYGSGNSVCFELSFDSPISAGTQLLDNYTATWYTGGWFSRAVLYTNEDGTTDNFTVQFAKMQDSLTRYFPEMKSDENTYLDFYSFGAIKHFKYYKKPNEIFALNYQLHFMPVKTTDLDNVTQFRDFLSNEYVKNNGFANGINRKKLYLVYCTVYHRYSILDTKGEDDTTVLGTADNPTLTEVDIDVIPPNYNATALSMSVKFTADSLSSNDWNNIKSWAIVDEEDNIYFASNIPPKENSDNEEGEFRINFISRHHRLS